MRTLNIVGAGKLGRTLARLWTEAGVFAVQDVLARHDASASAAVEFIGAGRPVTSLDAMRRAAVWMLTPPDGRIAAIAGALAQTGRIGEGDIVFHCSGAQTAAVLDPVTRCGAHAASMHPVKSIADPSAAVQSFAGTWCGAEGDPAALAVLAPAYAAIGARLFDIDPRSKSIYHAASVIVCNYLAALLETGIQGYEKAGLDRDTALQVLEPLVRETLDNVFRLGPAAALTGPIARGDCTVVAAQLQALAQWKPEVAQIYRALGAVAVEMARAQGGADRAALAAIERTLSGDGSPPPA